jgi:inner membrane protein
MDNLTHTAIGLFLSRAGLNRWTPRATPILLLAANAPDIDVISLAGGPLNYLHYHRHLSHSLVAMPMLAAAAVLLVRFAGRKPLHWLGAFCAGLIAVASHVLLDLTNIYGIRLFLPFSDAWQRLDWISVVDLWIWAAFAVALAGPFLSRLVGAEITSGSAKDRRPGRGFAIAALLFVLFYGYGRSVLHARAAGELQSRVYNGAEPLRIAAMPSPANPLEWRGLVETHDFYAVQDINLATSFDPMRATVLHKPEPDPPMDAARKTDTFRVFLQFSQFPLWRISPADEPENAHIVEVMDMRFGTPLAPAFVASALVDSRLRVLGTDFRWGAIRPR